LERDSGFESSASRIHEGIGGLEEKAAILLYLTAKNHSFADRNARIAAV